MNWFEKAIDGIVGAVQSVFSVFGGRGKDEGPEFTDPDYTGPVERTIDDAVDQFRDIDTPERDTAWIREAEDFGFGEDFTSWAYESGMHDPADWDSGSAHLLIASGGITIDYEVNGESYSAHYDDIHGFFSDGLYGTLYDEYEIDFEIDDEYSGA
jgi:hypothetical protein